MGKFKIDSTVIAQYAPLQPLERRLVAKYLSTYLVSVSPPSQISKAPSVVFSLPSHSHLLGQGAVGLLLRE